MPGNSLQLMLKAPTHNTRLYFSINHYSKHCYPNAYDDCGSIISVGSRPKTIVRNIRRQGWLEKGKKFSKIIPITL